MANTDISSKDACFVIMPFGGWFDSYYSTIYAPAIEEAGLIASRADDIYRPSTIVHDIWELTKKAKIVLADLTGKNANVFYELGLAHALAKPAILISETMDDVPFDLRALRVIEFDKQHPEWGHSLKTKIKNSIKEILNSPLNSVLPTFLEIKEEVQNKGKVTKQEKEILELKQDLEQIKSTIRTSRFSNTQINSSFFSEKEMIVLKGLGEGMVYKQFFHDYGLSESKVGSIVRGLYDKTGTRTSAELVKFAIVNGIL